LSVKLALLASVAVAAQVITIPIQRPPPPVDRPIAPIEAAGRAFYGTCKDWDEWDKPAPPVRIHGNTYLVGTCGIAAVLVTGSEGHILIDAGTATGADLVARNIRALGFRLEDVKFLAHSHEHFDHVGGIARLQQLTGARLVASPAAAAVFRTGAAGPGDAHGGVEPPVPPPRLESVKNVAPTLRAFVP
jgi:metallo-beta-lactamase class B